MLFLQASTMPKSFSPFCAANIDLTLHPSTSFSFRNPTLRPYSCSCFILSSPVQSSRVLKPVLCVPRKSDSISDPEPNSNPKAKPKKRSHRLKSEAPQNDDDENPGKTRIFPTTIPRKPRRGRRSEAAAVEDFVRDSLEQTFASIREQNSEVFENKEKILKERVDDNKINADSSEDDDDDDENKSEDGVGGNGRGKKMVVEEESPSWPLDADVGWGIRASEYFEQHPIKNAAGEDGVEIDWEGEIDDNWVKEINCLEWESFAFHPSPLIVFVFERYNR